MNITLQNIGEVVNYNYVVFRALDTMFKQPVQWFRKTVVEPSRGESYPWYHRQFRRIPSIDECYIDDILCREEAYLGSSATVNLLRERMNDCFFYSKGTCSLAPL